MTFQEQNKSWLNWVTTGLIFCLSLKILGYFTWSENINITRVLKIIMRFSSTGILMYIYWKVVKKGFVPSFNYKYLMPFILYLLYLYLGLLSLFWTSNLFYSTLQIFMTFESVVFLWWFFCIIEMVNTKITDYYERIAPFLAYSILPVFVIFIVGMFVDPDTFFRLTHGGAVARLGGFIMNPNELGMLASVGIGSLMVQIKFHGVKWYYVVFILFLVYGLLLTSSRSSLGSCVMNVGVFIMLGEKMWVKVACVGIGIFAAPIVFNEIILKEGDWEEVLTMTGRLPFWTALISEGLVERPWFGFGFMRIAEGDYFESVHTYAARMTHNTFVQVLMNLGFVGFFITCVQMASTFVVYIKQNRFMQLFFISVWIPIFINSITEFGIFGENNFGILFYQYLLIAPVISFRAQMINKKKIYNFNKILSN